MKHLISKLIKQIEKIVDLQNNFMPKAKWEFQGTINVSAVEIVGVDENMGNTFDESVNKIALGGDIHFQLYSNKQYKNVS